MRSNLQIKDTIVYQHKETSDCCDSVRVSEPLDDEQE